MGPVGLRFVGPILGLTREFVVAAEILEFGRRHSVPVFTLRKPVDEPEEEEPEDDDEPEKDEELEGNKLSEEESEED